MLGEICCYPTSHLPLGVTNEGREAIIISRALSKFLAPLSRTPIFKIGELQTIFYLCFLVLLVYLPIFILVSFIKNHKKNIYLAFSRPSCLVKHVRPWCFEGIGSSRFPSKGWIEYEEGMGQNF